MVANQNAKRVGGDFTSHFEQYARIAKSYEDLGIKKEERMVPYYMSDSLSRYDDLLTNDPEGFIKYVARPFIESMVRREFARNPKILKIRGENEAFTSMTPQEMEEYTLEVIDRITAAKWKDPQKFLKEKIAHKYLLAGFNERRMMSGGGLADVYLTIGKPKDEKKQYYATWYGKGQIIRISHEEAPSIYITGDPGGGKTNASHNLIEEMIANQYWVYTNMPVVSDYGNVFITRHFSDIYVDTPQMPSILRALLWARKHRISAGSYLVYDEGGRGAASKGTTLEGEALRTYLQIRRHYGSGMMQIGVQRMQPNQEKPGMLDYLIEAKRQETGKIDSKTRQPVFKYSWDIATRGPNNTTLHEFIHAIPLTRLTLNYANELRLPYPLDMDMDLTNFEKEVDFVTTPLEQLITDTRNFVRVNFRPELLGAPIYGEDDDEEEVEKRKEKEVLHEAVKSPAKKEDAEISADVIEAIGIARKEKRNMMQIASEFGLELSAVVRICRQNGWL
jgi:hypothetical protein